MDCAKLPYLLRAYYAWKNGLPFSYVDAISGSGDPRLSRSANVPVSRTEIVDRGGGINGARAMRALLDTVFTAIYRTDAAQTRGVLSDFYSPAIQPGGIRPGALIYDTNGHVGIVYRVDEARRLYYMDAHPDFTISRNVYGPVRPELDAAGGGLKNWRPLQLVGAHQETGRLVGGHIAFARNDQNSGFLPGAVSGHRAQSFRRQLRRALSYNGAPLGFYEYVRAAVRGAGPTSSRSMSWIPPCGPSATT